jgi:outer membrane protein OmpA-like peptidoglycan-associated protein
MKKILSILLLYFISVPALLAQQQYYDWYITGGPGAMAYYGDLSHKISSARINLPAYQLSIGRNISSSLALTLQGSYGRISANDRARDWNGALLTDNVNFSRGLNFQTDIRNASLLLSYRLNNGQVLSKHAALAPYFYGGIGVTDFTVYGDLYDENRQPYYYWSDNTIRDQPQQPSNEATAQVTGQDGNFETRLSGLATEQNYPTQVLSIPAGAGLKSQVIQRFSANLQAGANFTFSGYLDDVNGMYKSDYTSPEQAYAANPTGIMRDQRGNGGNDLYFAAFFSIGYHFNCKKKSFTPPVVYTGFSSPQTTVAMQKKPTDDANQPEDEPTPPPINNSTVAPAPETGLASPKQNTQPQNPNRNNLLENPDRQTVDINLRIMLEDGKMVVDTDSRQLKNSGAANKPGQRIDPSQEINNPADVELENDSDDVEVPSRKRGVDANVPPGKRPTQSSGNTALADDVRRLQQQVDSLKRTGMNAPTTSSFNTPNASRNNSSTSSSVQEDTALATEKAPNPQALNGSQGRTNANNQESPNNSAEIAVLKREVELLRQDLNRERSRSNNTRPQETMVGTQPERGPNTVTAVVPSNTGRQYGKKEMQQLENELAGVQTQLNELRSQKKIEPDTTLDNKIDSLLNLVSTIQTMNATQADQNSLNQNNARLLQQTQLTDSLQKQILNLNQSLKTMEKGLAAGIDTLSMGVPYTALGSTVVYYDVNMAQLKEADKQRLTVLGKKLKAEPSVLLLIKGFTDQTGNADYNLKLSQKRAENVKNYFIHQLGVQPEQILINYFGQQKSSSTAGNAYDRRVELELFREN